jgi:hypothetical protein
MTKESSFSLLPPNPIPITWCIDYIQLHLMELYDIYNDKKNGLHGALLKSLVHIRHRLSRVRVYVYICLQNINEQ